MKEEIKLGTTLRRNVMSTNIVIHSSGTTKENKNKVNSVLQQNIVPSVPTNTSQFRKSFVSDSTQKGLLTTAIKHEGRPASLYLPQKKNENKLNDDEYKIQKENFSGKKKLNNFATTTHRKEASSSNASVLPVSANQEIIMDNQENYIENPSEITTKRCVIIFIKS